MADRETTTIEVKISTYQMLNSKKLPGDSFDDVIRRLSDPSETDGEVSIAESSLSPSNRPQNVERSKTGEDTMNPPETDVGQREADQGAPDGPDVAFSTTIRAVDFPTGRDTEECIEAIEAAVRQLQSAERMTMREFVRDVMPSYPVGYDVPDLEPGDRFRGAWWRKVVKPGLEAHPDVEAPDPGGNQWRYVG